MKASQKTSFSRQVGKVASAALLISGLNLVQVTPVQAQYLDGEGRPAPARSIREKISNRITRFMDGDDNVKVAQKGPGWAPSSASSASSAAPVGGTNSGPPGQNPLSGNANAGGASLGGYNAGSGNYPGVTQQGAPGNPELFNPTSLPEGVPPPTMPIPNAGVAPVVVPSGAQGMPMDASGLSPRERKDDYDVINTQAENFRRRFLQGEAIELKLPMGEQLMPLGSKLPPIRLEATYTQPISLREVVSYCLDNNLAIRIQAEQVSSAKWLTAAQFGRYLPNALMLYRSQYQAGTTLIGGIIPVKFGNPFVNVSAGFQYFGFQGGAVTFNMLSNLHQYRATKQAFRASINDALNQVSQGYYNLVRNQALLQIQTRAVEVSKAQVQLNRQLERAGTGTRFQVLQSETQLARDQQNLLTQEVGLRNSAIDLATNLNLNATVNLLSVESEVRKVRLIDPSVDINGLINIAFQNRPELKQYKELWIASKRQIQLQVASLYPQFQFFGQYAGNGQTLTRKYNITPASVSAVQVAGAPTVQQYTTTTAAGASAINPSVGNGAVYNAGYVYNPPTINDRQIRKSYQIGMEVDWNFLNMGMPQAANAASAKALARQAALRINQQIMVVLQQVRESYLNSQTAERQIEVATKEVLSSAEELRLARVRLANGVGTNIDVINAQRDFTQALVDKADAIIQFNIQQVQLLHDIGVIGYDTLTSGRLVKAQ
ncbi:MAG: TolC family protein [Cyanobacteria bacterium REEB67]|nr:TolC family protein [Cyanobacteria bacterium REEB67]